MSNEIDAVEEFEKQQEEMEGRVVRRKVGGGASKVIGGLIIIIAGISVACFFVYKKAFENKTPAQSVTEIPNQMKSFGRTFDIKPEQPSEPDDKSAKAPTPPPVIVRTQPELKTEDVQLDENGLTPEQAAKARKLKSAFGTDNTGGGAQSAGGDGSGSGGSLSGKDGGSDNGLDSSLNGIDTVVIKPMARKSLDLMLTRGNSFPCSLQRAIDSTVPGQVVCITTNPVYSSSGKVLLLETGTKITGNYQGGMSQGQARIQITFDRLETPKKVFLSLRSPAIGQMGEGGVDGEIDTQFGKRFWNTILLSTIQDTVAAGTSHLAKDSGNSNVNLNNTSQATTDVANETLKNSINIPAILRKKPGEIINVDVLQDIDFSSVYRIEDAY